MDCKMDVSIRKWVELWEENQSKEKLEGTSLKYLPKYEAGKVPQNYINHSLGSKTLAQFRLGDARLIEPGHYKIQKCAVCNKREVKHLEAHVVFECVGVEQYRGRTFSLEFDFETPQKGDDDLLMKMKNFLGQDESQQDILEKRGLYLNKLRTEWLAIVENQ